MVGQRERKVEVERGRQVDVSAYVGRELQRLYKDTLNTCRSYTCGRPERKESGSGERESQVDVSAHVGRELQRLYKDIPNTYRRYTL